MSTTSRMSRGLGSVLLLGGALLAAAPGASAASTPATPNPPHIVDATVSGCQAPCAPGESGTVKLVVDQPSNGFLTNAQADGVPVNWNAVGQSNGQVTLFFSICSGIRQPFEGCVTQQQVDALRGDEVMTIRAEACTGDPDNNTQVCSPQSAPSNGVVPRQV